MQKLITGIWATPPAPEIVKARPGLRLTVAEASGELPARYSVDFVIGLSVAGLMPGGAQQAEIEQRVGISSTWLGNLVVARLPANLPDGRLHQPTMEAVKQLAGQQGLDPDSWLTHHDGPRACRDHPIEMIGLTPDRVVINVNGSYFQMHTSHFVAAGMRLALRQALVEAGHGT